MPPVGPLPQIESRIVPQLGAVKLTELTVSVVRAALREWAKDGTATANRTLRVGATMLQSAILDELLAKNPFAGCPRLKHQAKPLDPFSPAELRALVSAHGERYAVSEVVAFLAATGARIGEAAALDVGDYDPAAGTVAINKTWSRDHGTRDPKSKQSRRTIVVPEPARPAVLAAISGRQTGPLFPNAAGTRFDSAQLHIGLNRLLSKLQLRQKRGPHQLRHGVATMLVSRGVPLGDVAKYLGNTVTVLVRTYLHQTGHDVAGALTESLQAGV